MKLKRWLCVLVTLCMVITVLPLNAVRAVDVPKNEVTSGWKEIPFQVNPLYEGLIDPAEYEVEFSPDRWEVAPAASVTYLSEKDAAAKVRTNMINRVGEFTVYVSSDNSNYAEVLTSLLEETFKHTGKPKEGDSLQWQIAGYSGSYARDDIAVGKYGYTFNLVIPYYTTAAQEKELDTAVKNLLNKLNVGSKSAYDKVKAVYDYVCANVTYDNDHLNDTSYSLQFTPYAALVKKTAVCQGYALLMYRLMLELGVDIRLIAGIGGGEAHGWNIVKLDGYYYNLDSTWDAGVKNYSFFLKCRENFPEHVRYLDYDYVSFHKSYPMSDRDYAAGQTAKRDPYIEKLPLNSSVSWALTWDGVVQIKGSGNMPDFIDTRIEFIPYGETAPWMYWKDEIVKVVVESGIQYIGSRSFAEIPNLKNVSLTKGLVRIGIEAFYNCDGLTRVDFPEGLKQIGEQAFTSCEKLNTIKLPSSLELIDRYAFTSCVSLKEVTIPKKTVLNGSFSRCTGLKTVYLNNAVIGMESFRDCTSLNKVVLSNSVTDLGMYAFGGCSALTEIAIPASVEVIETNAFDGCSMLKTVKFLGNAPEIQFNAFNRVVATVYYPFTAWGWADKINNNYGGTLTWIPKCFNDHVDDGGTVTVPPTCTEEGLMTFTCVNCGETHTKPIPATGHTSGSSYVEVEPTCMSVGIMAHTCAVCNEQYWEDIPMLPHTCEDGICTACGNSVFRLAGANRWSTALDVADEMKANLGVEKFDAIIIASGSNFADALAGSYLSTKKNAPILLSWGQGGKYEYLDTDNIDYIKNNLKDGGTVYILGGVNAVPELYEAGLEGYDVVRLGGANRFETNILILEEAGIDPGSEILVCTSTNFADSLSASATGKPILLVWNERGVLYGDQPEFLASLEDCSFTVIGGENAVGTALMDAIGTYGQVDRLAGANRFETSVLVAQKYFEAPEYAVLAYAWNYPDGLCGGALAYTLDAPLVLTMTKYEAQAADYILSCGIEKAIVLGGESLISDDAIRTVFAMEAEAPVAVK